MFYPQSGTYAAASVQWDGDSYDGVTFDSPVAFRCHVQPMSNTTAFERFGLETSEAKLLICPKTTGILDFAKVIVGGITYKATGRKVFSDGLPSDHIEMALEVVRS